MGKINRVAQTLTICSVLVLGGIPQGWARPSGQAKISPRFSDASAIKAQSGCYHVTFTSKETAVTDPNYPIRSPDFREEGIEWITVNSESDGQIELQHILATPEGPLKHWTQQWRFEPQTFWPFRGPMIWQKETLRDSTGQWAQFVGQVDDSPRYECVAAWGMAARGAAWECETWTPLPRREFSQRSDYNVLQRRNRHQITADGWVHEQNNRKLLVKGVTGHVNTGVESGAVNGSEGMEVREIARELTINTYRAIEAQRCLPMEQWWTKNHSIWQPIKDVWQRLRANENELRFQGKVGGETLWMRLFILADEAISRSLPPAEIERRAEAEIQRFRY